MTKIKSPLIAVIATLTVLNTVASAAPVPAPPPRPAAPAHRYDCTAAQQQQDGDTAPGAQPRAADQGDLNGMRSRCRLADSDGSKEERINDGVDERELLQQINDWLDLNPRQAADDDGAGASDDSTVHMELSPQDHLMHAYIGSGLDRKDLGSITDEAGLLNAPLGADHAYPGDARALHANLDGRQAVQRARLTSAVPEPGAYALLLAGLALLGLRRLLQRRQRR